MDIHNSLLDMIDRADRTGALDLLEQWALANGYDRLIREVIDPALKEMGDRWVKDGISLAQGYIVAKVVEDIMQKFADQRAASHVQTQTKGPVIMGNIEDDSHALGRKMVVTFLKADGWDVCDMGTDVVPGDFVDKAVEIGAKVIGASAMMYTTAENIKSLRKEIDNRGLTGKIQLAVGGAVFVLRPELVKAVGGDGTAVNALVAPALFQDLWQKAIQMGANS